MFILSWVGSITVPKHTDEKKKTWKSFEGQSTELKPYNDLQLKSWNKVQGPINAAKNNNRGVGPTLSFSTCLAAANSSFYIWERWTVRGYFLKFRGGQMAVEYFWRIKFDE